MFNHIRELRREGYFSFFWDETDPPPPSDSGRWSEWDQIGVVIQFVIPTHAPLHPFSRAWRNRTDPLKNGRRERFWQIGIKLYLSKIEAHKKSLCFSTFFWALRFIHRIDWHLEINLSSWNHPRLINMTHMEKGRVHKKTKSLTFCYLALNPPPPVHIWAKWKYSSNTLRLKWFLWSWKKIGKSKHLSFISSSKINKGQNLLFNLSLCKQDLQ